MIGMSTADWSLLPSPATMGIEVHVVPGDHYTILTPPHVHSLSRRLLDCVARRRQSITKSPPAPRGRSPGAAQLSSE